MVGVEAIDNVLFGANEMTLENPDVRLLAFLSSTRADPPSSAVGQRSRKHRAQAVGSRRRLEGVFVVILCPMLCVLDRTEMDPGSANR